MDQTSNRDLTDEEILNDELPDEVLEVASGRPGEGASWGWCSFPRSTKCCQ